MVVDEDDDGIGVRVQYTLGSRLETELARLLRVLVEEAAQEGIEVLVLRMESNKLSKSLLQRTSAVRSPRYFEEILKLHEVVTGRSVHVIVGGPSKMPISVLERVQDSRDFAQS
jgi:hypothetical protein